MSVIDTNRIVNSNQEKEKTIQYCIDFVKEFLSAAKKTRLKPIPLNAKMIPSEMLRNNVTRKEWVGLARRHWADIYVLLVGSEDWDDDCLQYIHGACITSNGSFYLNDKLSSAQNIGKHIAYHCGYIQEIAEQCLYDALKREPWSEEYANEQAENYNSPKISVNGNENVVGGHTATRF